MLQTKFKLNTYTLDTGEKQVLAYVRHNGKQFTLATDVHVDPKRWTTKRGAVEKWVVKGENRRDLNRKLERLKAGIDKKIRFAESHGLNVLQHLTEAFKPDPNAPDKNDLIAILQSIVDSIEARNTRQNLQGALNKLKAYGEIKTPDDLTKQTFREFSEWLLTPKNEGGWGLAKDSGAKAVTNALKTLTNKAVELDRLPPLNLGVLRWQPQPQTRISLTIPELERMKAATLNLQVLDFVRDCYVFCALTSLRFREMQAITRDNLNLRKTENGYLGTVQRMKRKRFQQDLPLTNEAVAILEKWHFNLNRYNGNTHNRRLKEIGRVIEMTESERLTVVVNGREQPYLIPDPDTGNERYPYRWELLVHHTSRNTFISHAYQNRIPERVIQQIADHDDPAQTRRYDRTQDSVYARDYLNAVNNSENITVSKLKIS